MENNQIMNTIQYPIIHGHEVTFVYGNTTKKEIESIVITGNLQWFSYDDLAVASFMKKGHCKGARAYSSYEYLEGMFNTGYHPAGESLTYPLVEIQKNQYELTLTLPSNEYCYQYVITYKDGTVEKIQDPNNPCPSNEFNGHDSNWSLFYVGNKNDASKGQEYIYSSKEQNGHFEFIPYKAIDSTTQYLGVYIPYNYNPNKEYKTVYISHGGGGNEAEWPYIGSAINIFDNLIADSKVVECLFVTMDNTYFAWDYDVIARNLKGCIIPIIESKYSVGSKQDDRAFCGLSMGAMTATTLLQSYTTLFGIYGCFSGANVVAKITDLEALKKVKIYLTGGCVDMAVIDAPEKSQDRKTIALSEKFDALGVKYGLDLKGGAHDWGVWRAALITFIIDYLWNK